MSIRSLTRLDLSNCRLTDAAAAATPLADVVAAPPDDVPYGEVVRQAPAVGSLFFDRMVFGTSGPSWDWFPPGLDWVVFGVMIAAFTVAVLAYLNDPEAPAHRGGSGRAGGWSGPPGGRGRRRRAARGATA